MLCKTPLRGHAQAAELLLTASCGRESSGQFRLSRTPVSPHFVDSQVQVPGRTVVRLPYPSDAGCRPRFCQFCRLPAVPRDVRREQRAPVHVRSSPTIDRTARQVEALAPLVGVASAGSISDAHRGAEDRSPPVELFERLYAFLRRFKPPTHAHPPRSTPARPPCSRRRSATRTRRACRTRCTPRSRWCSARLRGVV